jgi:hypothetical protein
MLKREKKLNAVGVVRSLGLLIFLFPIIMDKGFGIDLRSDISFACSVIGGVLLFGSLAYSLITA